NEAILEREQSLKLVRTWSTCVFNSKDISLPTEIVRTIISVADHAEDKLRYLALETLCEMALSNLPLVSMCGGIRTLCDSLLWAPPDIVEWIVISLMLLLDAPSTRQYFRPGLDLEVIIISYFFRCAAEDFGPLLLKNSIGKPKEITLFREIFSFIS
ncbi:hypothetical protein HMI56_005982, partial [Coelomomyces lativittatus]